VYKSQWIFLVLDSSARLCFRTAEDPQVASMMLKLYVPALQLVKKRLPPPGHPLSAPSTSPQRANGAAATMAPCGEAFISPEDYVAQDEIYKASTIQTDDDWCVGSCQSSVQYARIDIL
jgi:hypothetical protein